MKQAKDYTGNNIDNQMLEGFSTYEYVTVRRYTRARTFQSSGSGSPLRRRFSKSMLRAGIAAYLVGKLLSPILKT